MTVEAQLKALKDLRDHPGYAILVEAWRRSELLAAERLADPQVHLDSSIQFLRGALWAVQQNPHLLEQLISIKESELSLSPREPKKDR